MYNPDYGFVQQGWECPKCHRIYSPNQSFCLYCSDKRVTYATGTSIIPEWIYKENTSTGRVIDDWWNRPTSIPWEDMIRRTGLLEDE